MKTLLQLIIALMISMTSYAQSTVSIQINHLLEGVQYENEVSSTNNLDNDFMIDRLQYYLSGFSIVHDGGQITEVPDLYVLVSLLESSEPTIIEMGEYNINSLESVKFHFGVDEEANHADPSLLPWTHPLAPQLPSMHWGWAAGYRFIALEGMSGPNLDQDLQFHCIGDEFYTEMEFVVNLNNQSEYALDLDAEYTNLLMGIDVTSGLIIHGGTNEVIDLAENIATNVFSLSGATSTEDSELVNEFNVFPNPVNDGLISINMDIAGTNNTVSVYDVMGKMVFTNTQSSTTQVELNSTGMYLVTVADNKGTVLATRKVIVQ